MKPLRSRLIATALFVVSKSWILLAIFSVAMSQAPRDDDPPQDLDSICKCAGDAGKDRGGARTFEEFNERYGSRFTAEWIGWAWKVYAKVNQCDAKLAIGPQ